MAEEMLMAHMILWAPTVTLHTKLSLNAEAEAKGCAEQVMGGRGGGCCLSELPGKACRFSSVVLRSLPVQQATTCTVVITLKDVWG